MKIEYFTKKKINLFSNIFVNTFFYEIHRRMQVQKMRKRKLKKET